MKSTNRYQHLPLLTIAIIAVILGVFMGSCNKSKDTDSGSSVNTTVANRAPVLTSPGNQTIDEGQVLTFTLSATDPDSDAIVYSMVSTPIATGATLDSGTGAFSWTTNFTQSGDFNVTFRATDTNGLFDEEAITISVGDVNRPPVLSAIGNQSVNEGVLLTFVITATDPDANGLTYSATGLPTGAAFDPGTRTFSWMPTNDQANTYTNIIFAVTDNGVPNLADSETITITVNDVFELSNSGGGVWSNYRTITITNNSGGTLTDYQLSFQPFRDSGDFIGNNLNNTGLIGSWAMNEGTGITATDLSGNGNNGTLANSPTWTAGRYGNALKLNAANHYVTIPHIPAYNTGTITIELWIKGIPSGTYSKLIGKGPDSTEMFGLYLRDTGEYKVERHLNGTAGSINTGAMIGDNTWHYLVYTYDGTIERCYVDGVQRAFNPIVGSLTSNNEQISIGKEVSGSPDQYYPFNGIIDEVKIYNNALSAQEVALRYGSGLVGSWHFSEITGTAVAADMSGNGNNGQLGTTSGADASDPAWNASGRFGNALTFDGVDDYVAVANEASFDITAQVTVESWVKLSATQTASTMWSIAAKGYDGIFPYALIHTNNTGIDGAKYGFAFGGVTGGIWKLAGSTNSGSLAAVGQWYYVVGTYDGAKFNIYVDGAFVASSDNTTIALNNVPVSIGAFYENGPPKYFFNGAIDEVRIYNRALSADEIAARYNNNAPKVKGDYSDIRFTNSAGTAELAYWQETDNRFYLKIPNLPNGDTAIRMYYGNISATDSSNLANVYGAGIVGFWPFSEGAGTITYDRSVNKGNGTLYNSPTWTVSGRYGNALSFDGNNDYLATISNTGISGTAARTVEFWANMNNNPSSGLGFSLVYFGTASPILLFAATVTRPGGGLSANRNFYFAGYGDDLLGVAALSLSTWYHFAITYDGTTLKMYVNGVLDNSTAKTLNTANNVVVMGYPPAGDWSYYNGLIDETRIYNRVLTVDEIASRYVAPANDPAIGAPGVEQ